MPYVLFLTEDFKLKNRCFQPNNLILWLTLLILQPAGQLRGPLPMQAQVKQKASDEILSDCLITIFSHSTKEGGLPQNGVGGGGS